VNINPNKWSCMPTAFANVIGYPLGFLIKKIGHDGSEKVGDGHRGFHSQEIIEVLDDMGWKVTCIDLYPVMGYESGELDVYMGNPKDRLKDHMAFDMGVLCGILIKEEVPHAVTWDLGNKRIYDPRGVGLTWAPEDFLYKHFEPKLFFKVRP